MYGFKPGEMPKDKARGGKIKGPGTGTSDSIKTEVPVGSYIMPADSTEKLGERTLSGLGKPAPVSLSNGEYQMPPEQVHAVGVKVLDQIKDATHAPSGARGFKVQDGDLYFADGGAVAESTDELLARIQAKYGTGGSSSASPQPQAQVQRPAAPAPVPAPTIAGAVGALQNRRQQIDAAAGYADGGAVQPVRGLGFGPTSVGARMLNGRQSFSGGGDVEDPDKPQSVPGAPGVQRVGNTYSAAPEASTRTPTMGQTMNRINNERVERMGGKGMYQPAIEEAGRAAAGAFSNTRTAIRGAGDNIAESYQAGGLPAAVGATVRNTMVPAIGFAHDVAASAKRLLDPAANALKTAVTGNPTPIGEQKSQGTTPADPEPNAVKPTQPAPAAEATPQAAGFNDLTLQQRNTAGDAYREAWQQQAPGGLRGAGANALDLYNAEQLIRGTGITAQRDANGRMSFSGDGTNALPQNYTSGFDLNLANQIQARANAIRGETVALQQRMADDANFARGVTGARKTTPEERRELAEIQTDRDRRSAIYNQNRLQEEMARARFFGDGKAMENIATQMALVGNQQSDIRDDVRAREASGDQLAQQRDDTASRNALERQRLGLEQQRVGSEVAERGFNINRLERMERLQQQFEQADTPEKRAALAEQFRVFSGQEAPNRFTVVPGGQEWDAQANAMRTVPARVLNNQTGEFVGQPASSAARPTLEQYAAQIRAKNPSTSIADEDIAARYKSMYG